MGKIEFIEELKSNFIPRLITMIEKEEAHLLYLKESLDNLKGIRIKVVGLTFDFKYLTSLTNYDTELIEEMIRKSEAMIGFFTQKLDSYKVYCNINQ